MKLNQEQIQDLYKFTRQHFVEWYDLQTELVDHLVNDIENTLQDNNTLTFNEAKNRSFSKFGICGFQDIVIERQKVLYKKYWKLVWFFLRDYFKIPKIILTIGLTGLVYTFLNTIPHKEIVVSVLLILYLILPFVYIFIKSKEIKKHQKFTGKKWLFEDTVKTLGGFLTILQIFGQSLIFIINSSNWSQYLIFVFSLFFVLCGFFFYIGFSLIPKKITHLLVQQFPEYNQPQKA